ncbi:MAG: hypothetical protein IJF12_03245 [Alphaproteobacteria bacterium]|nr:hypothetical protein [Alphaproteobacteria bacterium]
MRKYFLLSAVALLATSTANATTDYAEVTAKATIEVATKYGCDELNLGKIVVKKNNTEFTFSDHDQSDDNLISVENNILDYHCEGPFDVIIADIDLTNPDAPDKVIKLHYEGDTAVYNVTIPANITAGEYSGTTTMTIVDDVAL